VNQRLATNILSAIRYQSASQLGAATVWRWKIALNIVDIVESKESFFRMVLLAVYLRENGGKGIEKFKQSSVCKKPLSHESEVKEEVEKALDIISKTSQQAYKIEEVYLWD
jgi:hypothetical protein